MYCLILGATDQGNIADTEAELKELFLKVRKKWWLLPIIVVMLLLGTLLVFA